jgi:hypothetical protein
MEKVAFILRGKRRERVFSSSEAAREFIRLATAKFGEDIQDFHPTPSPKAIADSSQAAESQKVKSA